MLMKGTALAERIVSKETQWSASRFYDVKTHVDSHSEEKQDGVFAKLLRFEASQPERPPVYRVCIQDTEIMDFIRRVKDIDLVSLFTFIMTHELLHIHRFSTGKADFFDERKEDEEALVDSLTRLLLAKNPVTGLKNVLSLLDKVEAAPLYSFRIFADNRRCINAYL